MNKFLIALTTASVIGFTNVPAGDYNDSMKEGMPASGKAGAMGKTMDHTGMQTKHEKHMKCSHMKADHIKAMDLNSDGMITREEFTKHHEMMFDKMEKNPKGAVDIKKFGMMHGNHNRP